jgi:hypothetical protein
MDFGTVTDDLWVILPTTEGPFAAGKTTSGI